MALEILEYDVVGNGLALNVRYRRRPVFASDPSLPVPKNADGTPAVAVDASGVATKMIQPQGPVSQVQIAKENVDPATWANLLSAFAVIEGVVSLVAEAHVAAIVATPATLDAKIDEAARAGAELAILKVQSDLVASDLAAKQAEAVKLDAMIAARRDALALLATAPTEPAPPAAVSGSTVLEGEKTSDDVPASP